MNKKSRPIIESAQIALKCYLFNVYANIFSRNSMIIYCFACYDTFDKMHMNMMSVIDLVFLDSILLLLVRSWTQLNGCVSGFSWK